MVNEKTIKELLIEYRAIEFGDFILASGAISRYYIDIKTAMTHPELLNRVAKEFSERGSFDLVAGVAVGGVPLAVATGLAAGKEYAIVRQVARDHGKSGVIIGDVKGRKVLLVEDVTTSGGSALYGVEQLRAAGASVTTVMTVVDREQGAVEALAAVGVRLIPLVRASELLNR